MGSLAKRLEVVANVAIIVVAVLLCVVLVKKYLLKTPQTMPVPPALIAAGGGLGGEW